MATANNSEPTASLTNPNVPVPSKILRFPSDIGNYPLTAINVYKVSYEINKNSATSKITSGLSNLTGGALDATSSGLNSFASSIAKTGAKSGGAIPYTSQNIIPSVKAGTNSLLKDIGDATSAKATIEEIISINLPLPIDLNVNYNHEWSGNSLSALQYTLRQLAQSGYSDVNGAIEKGTKFMGAEIIKNFLGNSKVTGISAANNIAFNPYRELLFTSTSFRTFNLEWVLSPRNVQESNVLNEMVWSLKKYSHAQTLGNKDLEESLILHYPFYCDIALWSNETSQNNPFFHKFLQCAITNVSVRYESKLHAGNYAPAATSLSLGLLETKILTQNDFGETFSPSTQTY